MKQNEILLTLPENGNTRQITKDMAIRLQTMLAIQGSPITVSYQKDPRPTPIELMQLNNFTSQMANAPLTMEKHLQWINSWLKIDLTDHILKVEHYGPSMADITIDTTAGPANISIVAMVPNGAGLEPIEYVYAFGDVRQMFDTTRKTELLDLRVLRRKQITCIGQLTKDMAQICQLQGNQLRQCVNFSYEQSEGDQELFWKILNERAAAVPEGMVLEGYEFKTTEGNLYAYISTTMTLKVPSRVIADDKADLYLPVMVATPMTVAKKEEPAADSEATSKLTVADITKLLQGFYDGDKGFAEWRSKGFGAKSLATNLIRIANEKLEGKVTLTLNRAGITCDTMVIDTAIAIEGTGIKATICVPIAVGPGRAR